MGRKEVTENEINDVIDSSAESLGPNVQMKAQMQFSYL